MRNTYLRHQCDRLLRLGYPLELLTDDEIRQHCRPADEHRMTRPKFDERRNNDRLEHPICRLSDAGMREAIKGLSDRDLRLGWLSATGEGRHEDGDSLGRELCRRNSKSEVRNADS